MSKIQVQQLAFRAQLLDPELVFRSIGFISFVSTWLLRQADPARKHPTPVVSWVLLFVLTSELRFAHAMTGFPCRRRYQWLSALSLNIFWKI
jgi:hypothetical protein